VSFVHGADSKQLIFLILLKSFMVGRHWVLCLCSFKFLGGYLVFSSVIINY
jgi:hypothetical protein